MQRLGTDIKVNNTKNKSHVRTNKTQYKRLKVCDLSHRIPINFFRLFVGLGHRFSYKKKRLLN
jgi:hypothetical protein